MRFISLCASVLTFLEAVLCEHVHPVAAILPDGEGGPWATPSVFIFHDLYTIWCLLSLLLYSCREAARECRRKKKEYVRCLENRVAILESQNQALIGELRALKELYLPKSDA